MKICSKLLLTKIVEMEKEDVRYQNTITRVLEIGEIILKWKTSKKLTSPERQNDGLNK